MQEEAKKILRILAVTQFAATTLWFSANAVLSDLGFASTAVASLTSAVQLGFIVGTLSFAMFNIADRFSPRLIFLISCILGAAANALILVENCDLTTALASRFITGFFLAGIYPVAMKIAASWFDEDLGFAVSILVGALVLGTPVSHFLKTAVQPQTVIVLTSLLATTGGLTLYLFVPNGPLLPSKSKFSPKAVVTLFKDKNFRSSAVGYFGHMWELYAFWAFVPIFLTLHLAGGDESWIEPSMWVFNIIAVGSIGCVFGGVASRTLNSAFIAALFLAASSLCCLLSPLMFQANTGVFLIFLLLWGVVVVGDSPQLSALNASFAPKEYVGTALTLVTSIGFAITIASIQLLDWFLVSHDPKYLFLLLAPGPMIGLISLIPPLRQFLREKPSQ